jgi:3-deoxy-7-phosphoheptulonate synthase
MLVVMSPQASDADVNYVVRRARSLGLKAHLSRQNSHTLIGLLGDFHGLSLEALAGLRGVEEVRPTAQAFRLASREFRPDCTLVTVRDVVIGEPRLAICAGPCSVESADQVLRIAELVRQAGGRLLRGGAFKPRSSPYSFQGLAEAGLEHLAKAREVTGLAVVTEVLSSEQVPLVSQYADVLQIGARNMQNYALLHAVGESQMPILLKRGMMSSIEELLLSAEYILSHGNPHVILCERGIRTFETYTRNTLDINAVPALRELTHLPVIVDPSHATGRASLVKAVSRAAVAVGADGLIIEVHDDPERAWSDGFQSITPATFRQLMTEIRRVAEAVDRSV